MKDVWTELLSEMAPKIRLWAPIIIGFIVVFLLLFAIYASFLEANDRLV